MRERERPIKLQIVQDLQRNYGKHSLLIQRNGGTIGETRYFSDLIVKNICTAFSDDAINMWYCLLILQRATIGFCICIYLENGCQH